MPTLPTPEPPAPRTAPAAPERPTAGLLSGGLVTTVLGCVLIGASVIGSDPSDPGTARGALVIGLMVLAAGVAALATGVHRVADRSDRRAGVPPREVRTQAKG